MSKEIVFHHGALCDPYEQQANAQGFTLGKEREILEELGFSLVIAHIHSLLTESQYDAALKKLQKKLVKALKPLPEPPKEG